MSFDETISSSEVMQHQMRWKQLTAHKDVEGDGDICLERQESHKTLCMLQESQSVGIITK